MPVFSVLNSVELRVLQVQGEQLGKSAPGMAVIDVGLLDKEQQY